MTRSRSYIATPPGATIKEQLIERGMSQKEFSARMNMSEKHISKLINGDVQLTVECAVRLETVLGVPAKFWNNLEAIYREKLIKVAEENSMEQDEVIADNLPYDEMVEFGWVSAACSNKERVLNLRRFFEVVELSLLSDKRITRIACKRLVVTEKSDLALMAWAQQAKIEAHKVQTNSINIKGLSSCIDEMNHMNIEGSDEELKKLLSEFGIALVVLPSFKESSLQGATFIDGNKIVIGLVNDNFKDNLFHELGHIMLGHIEKTGGITEQDELEVNNWVKVVMND